VNACVQFVDSNDSFSKCSDYARKKEGGVCATTLRFLLHHEGTSAWDGKLMEMMVKAAVMRRSGSVPN
jgi:hypothetical protein